MHETINTICQMIMAFCALGVLVATLWKIPRRLDTKIAVVRLLFVLSSLASFGLAVYFGIIGHFMEVAVWLMAYVLLVQSTFFVTARGGITRGEILSMILTAVFLVTIPVLLIVRSMLTTDRQIIGILQKITEQTDRKQPTPIPSPTP